MRVHSGSVRHNWEFATDSSALSAAGPQIVPVYGTDFRSTPVFFLQDDHDYFDNDEAFDEIVTFPPVWFQLELGRATQRLSLAESQTAWLFRHFDP